MRVASQALITAMLLLLLLPAPAFSKDIRGKVVSVADGDTITILDSNKQQHKIRLYGIDSPEGGQAFGSKAKKATSILVYGKIVDVNVLDRDRYGRDVGIVYNNGINVNAEIIMQGYAWVYTRYCKIKTCSNWEVYEAGAKNKKLGLWVDPNSIPPWDYRAAQNTPQSQPAFTQKSTGSSVKTQPVASDGNYHGNLKSKVFHAPGCQHYNCKNCTRSFSSIGAATSAGYRPHSQCVK